MWKVLLVALLPLALATQSKFVVKNAPGYVQLDSNAGPIQSGDVANVLTSMMGFESSTTLFEWNGLKNANVFRRPAACLSILLDGFTDDLSFASRGTYAMNSDSLSGVLLGNSHISVASAISESTESFSLSMSSDDQFAVAGAARDVSTGRDFTVTFHPGSGFHDSSNTFVAANFNDGIFGSGVFGPNIVHNQASKTVSVSVSGSIVSLDLANPIIYNALLEVYSMVTVLNLALIAGATSPSVYTFSVANLAAVKDLSAAERGAIAVVLAAFIDKMDSLVSNAFDGNVVTVVVSSSYDKSQSAHHHVVARSTSVASAVSDPNYFPAPTSRDYVAYCQTYTCYPNVDSNNNIFDTGNNPCQKNCARNQYCECAYFPIPCGPTSQPGSAVCSGCLPGFSLQGGQCYVDSNFPGMFQIWFWGGIGLALALIATCYAVGGMDPGTNGVIYRMTTQRMKSS